MKRWPPKTVQITIPSALGFEKIAILTVSEVAKSAGLSAERIMDLCTALGEACINAIEHGNQGIPEAAVVVTIAELPGSIQVEIMDCGQKQLPPGLGTERPNLEERIEGKMETRGWGIYLMRQLVDLLEFESKPGRNITRLIIRFNAPE